MTRLLRTGAVAAAYLAIFAACTLGPTVTGDAGAAATGTDTVGDQCQAVSTELCLKGPSCGIDVGTLSDCVASVMLTCCTGSGCNAISTSSALVVSSCKSAIDAEDCNSYVNNQLPTYCTALFQPS